MQMGTLDVKRSVELAFLKPQHDRDSPFVRHSVDGCAGLRSGTGWAFAGRVADLPGRVSQVHGPGSIAGAAPRSPGSRSAPAGSSRDEITGLDDQSGGTFGCLAGELGQQNKAAVDAATFDVACCLNMQLWCPVMAHFDGEAALRALADPRRRQMLMLAWDRERSPSELAMTCQLSRPATSQHLKVLREAGLISVRLEGNRRMYRARADRLAELRVMLDEFWGSRLASLQAGLNAPGGEASQ
jgi:DNA-binding transcriptional ArsR family regulator